MGWTYLHTDDTSSKWRKQYIDSHWTGDRKDKDGNVFATLKVLKSSMVGSTYYSAVEVVKPEERYVFAVVYLTNIARNDWHNFGYKDMDETYGPCECKCPKGILELLTPTDNETANNWRKRVQEYWESQKSSIKPKIGELYKCSSSFLINWGSFKIEKDTEFYIKYTAWGKHKYFLLANEKGCTLNYRIMRKTFNTLKVEKVEL